MEDQTLDQRFESFRTSVVLPGLNVLRTLIASANEAAPTVAFPGFTADEQQNEVIAQATLALRALEEVGMRVSKATHAFLADDTSVVGPPAAEIEAVAPEAEAVEPEAAPTAEGGDTPAAG